MSELTTAKPSPAQEQAQPTDEFDLAKALRKAYNFGQAYWQQADSEYLSQQKKSNETADKFAAFVDETVAARAAQPQAAIQAPAGDDDPCLKMMCLVEYYMAAVDWHGSQNGEKCDAAIEVIGQYLRALAAPAPTVAAPSVKQLTAQLEDYDEKWTPEEQRQFAVFLQRFPNESSQGIISLGSAWKHGKASALTAPTGASQSASIEVQLFVIKIEKKLCAALGWQWRSSGMCIDSLIAELSRLRTPPAAMPAQASVVLTNEQIRKTMHNYSRMHQPGHYSDTEFDCLQDVIGFVREIVKQSTPPAPAPAIQAQPLTDAEIITRWDDAFCFQQIDDIADGQVVEFVRSFLAGDTPAGEKA